MKLSDITIQKLIDLITVQKKYLPGDKIPNEECLSKELGVSRNTVRSAVRYLVGQGVLEIKIGKGTYVVNDSKIFLDFGFNRLQYLHLKLHDLYELRLMLEPQVAYYAAIRASDDEIKNILELGIKLQTHNLQGLHDIEGNRHFHSAIVKAAHNEFCTDLSEIIYDALEDAFAENGLTQKIDDFYTDHQLIMDYLQQHDPDGTKLAMDLHLKHSIKIYNL